MLAFTVTSSSAFKTSLWFNTTDTTRPAVEVTELKVSLLESHDLHFPTETETGAGFPLWSLCDPAAAAEGFWVSGLNHNSQTRRREVFSFHVTQKLFLRLPSSVIMWNHFPRVIYEMRKCRISSLLVVMFGFQQQVKLLRGKRKRFTDMMVHESMFLSGFRKICPTWW